MAEVQDIRKIQEVFDKIKLNTPKEDKPRTKKEKKAQKEKAKSNAKTTRKNKSNRYNQQYSKFVALENATINQAVKTIIDNSNTNFNESLEVHINLGIDPRNSEQRIRFSTTMPHGTGKTTKILVIGNESKDLDNIIYRDISVIPSIIDGKLQPGKDFDVVITTPDKMKDLAKVARILGPKGMMPSPKNGTVSNDIESTIEQFSSGQIEIKSQNNHAVVHQIVGNLEFGEKKLVENTQHLLEELRKRQPAKLKKSFIQNAYLTSTMSPSIKITTEQ